MDSARSAGRTIAFVTVVVIPKGCKPRMTFTEGLLSTMGVFDEMLRERNGLGDNCDLNLKRKKHPRGSHVEVERPRKIRLDRSRKVYLQIIYYNLIICGRTYEISKQLYVLNRPFHDLKYICRLRSVKFKVVCFAQTSEALFTSFP